MGFPRRLASAKRMAVAFDNYIEYMKSVENHQPNIGSGRKRPTAKVAFIKPFGFDIAANQYIPQNATSQAAWDAHHAKMENFVLGALPADTQQLKPKRFSAARVVFVTVTATPTVATSHRTKLKYLKYSGVGGTTSIPFGRGTQANADEVDVFNLIKAGVYGRDGTPPENLRLSLRREKA